MTHPQAAPRYASPITRGVDLSQATAGAMLLGLPLLAQGKRAAGLMESMKDGERRYKTAVIQMPRRSTKTTSIWAVILGRASAQPGYRCVTTAQSGAVASRILLEHAEMMLRAGHAVESSQARSGSDKPVLFRNGGRERLEFPNGARIWVVPPEAGAVRSAAADDIVIDEAGTFEGDRGSDFYAGVLPLMDTKGPLAQLIVAGTPGSVRSGMFWDELQDARAGKDDETGILDYSAADDDDPEDREVWARVHPGPSSGLTPMKVLERRRQKLGAVQFAREYLCIWPFDSTVNAINLSAWDATRLPPPKGSPLPERFGLAFDVNKDSSSAALAAAWRDEEGIARVAILQHRMGTSWLAPTAHLAARKYRVPLRFDNIGTNLGPASELTRMRGVRLVPGTTREAIAATQKLTSDITERRLRHFGQSSLTAAAHGATWRQLEGGRLFQWRNSMVDITPLNAAAWALWEFDQTPARQPLRIVRAGGGTPTR